MSLIEITKTKEDKIYHVQMNLPEKRNALTPELILELTDVFSQLSENSSIHACVLSGKGSNFCAGGDLRWMLLQPESADSKNQLQVENLFKLFDTIHSCPVPVIGKIHGSVFGGGIGLVSVCDIVVAQKATQFCFSELKLSLIPSTIAPFVLEKISPSQFKELVLSARIFSTEEALRLGLIHAHGNDKECEKYINKFEDQLLSYDVSALRQSKKLFNNLFRLASFKEKRDYCIQSLVERRKHPEVSERISKFLKTKK